MNRKIKNSSIKNRLREFREKRERIKREDAEVKKEQPELISMMQEVDPNNHGIVVNPDDSKGTAFVQQNDGSLVWDEEEILDWLNKPSNKALKNKATSRVFDPNKWEALVASKEVPPKIANRFKTRLPDPKPFIRWGKRKDESE